MQDQQDEKEIVADSEEVVSEEITLLLKHLVKVHKVVNHHLRSVSRPIISKNATQDEVIERLQVELARLREEIKYVRTEWGKALKQF